jgi:hypothetical protein
VSTPASVMGTSANDCRWVWISDALCKLYEQLVL